MPRISMCGQVTRPNESRRVGVLADTPVQSVGTADQESDIPDPVVPPTGDTVCQLPAGQVLTAFIKGDDHRILRCRGEELFALGSFRIDCGLGLDLFQV